MGRRRNKVGVREGARVEVRGDESRDVRHIHHQARAALFGNVREALEVEEARVGARARDDEPRPMFHGQALELVVVDCFRIPAASVGNDLVHLP